MSFSCIYMLYAEIFIGVKEDGTDREVPRFEDGKGEVGYDWVALVKMGKQRRADAMGTLKISMRHIM